MDADTLHVVAVLELSPRLRTAAVLDSSSGLPRSSVRSIYEDADGNIWFGTFDAGLAMLPKGDWKRGKLTFYTTADGLPDNGIRSIIRGPDNNMYIGTRYGGVAVFDGRRFVGISVREGLMSNAIWGMAVEGRDRIWLGTSAGMQYLTFGVDRQIGSKSALVGDQVHSCGVYRDEFLWVVTSEGLTVYRYPTDSTALVPPPVYIDGISVNGNLLPSTAMDGGLPYDQNNCSFEFQGISFRDESAVRYRYRLLGVGDEWSPSTSQRALTFANLKPGSYRFEVKAVNVDGVSSIVPAGVSFSILPPFWERWWFLLLSGLACCALLLALYRYRVHRLLELQRLRLRIASDLHDDVGTNLSSIVVASQIMSRTFDASEAERSQLAEVGAIAAETQDLMRDIVWMLSPRNDSLDDLILKMKDLALRLLKDISCEVRTPPGSLHVPLNLEFKRNVLLIFKESVNNVLKHAHATSVAIEVREEDRVLHVIVSDNGVGFDVSAARRGNGLVNLQNRASRLGGTVEVASRPNGGTSVHLAVKIT
jgi:two-component sensor histidine kinase